MAFDVPYWLETPPQPLPPLEGDARADAVVIGGGVAGLTAAQLLAARGLGVVVLERDTCGSGATGRSSGFMTPDSELQVEQLARRFGDRDGGMLWRAASSACEHVRETIEAERIDCDYLPCDSLYAALDASGRSTVESEHEARRRLGLESALVSREGFEGGVRYGGTFAITPYRYAVGLRDRLRRRGVRVYEQSEVTAADGARVSTANGSVQAKMIFFCADRHLANLGHARAAAYHAQTFLASTDPLPARRFDALFPDGDLLVWDTGLIYHYFRRTADDRLLLGGGLLRKTYASPADPAVMVEDFRAYLRERVAVMADVRFTNLWSGLIGVTKDLLPLAGPDAKRPSHFYAGCAAGIPWSVLAARCAVECALDGASDLETFFDPRRSFALGVLQPLLRKPATFALSHALVKGALPSLRRRRGKR